MVTERLPERIAHTVFVEAFVPQDGKSLLEVAGLDVDAEQRAIQANGGRWAAPTRAELERQPYLTPEQRDWLIEKSVAQPGRTVTEPVQLATSLADITATVISSHRAADDLPEPLAKLKESPTWSFKRLEGGHWTMLSKQRELTQMLSDITTRG